MALRLNGKLAVVTGGGSGIGRAICEVFAREGACVAMVDVNESSAQDTLKLLKGFNHCVVQGDVSNSEDVKRVFETVEAKLGRKCDILVNNAGIGNRLSAVSEMNESDFNNVINVNLRGVFLMAKEFLKSVEGVDKDVRGVLVNVSSLAGKIGFPSLGAYASSKAGVIGLTKSIAGEFAVHQVRCNVVLPGWTDTTLGRRVPKEYLKQFEEKMVMKRYARPEEIANVCLFLASEESSYVHGSCIEVTGGLGM